MSYSDLLERMMQRDADAFLEMTERYGWTLYNAIRQKYSDKAEADRIYDETMQQFYRCLQNPNCEDPMEALLCAWAEYVSGKKGFLREMLQDDQLEAPPAVQAHRLMQSHFDLPEKRQNRIGSFLFVFLMLLILAGCTWIIVGFLMERNILPFVDFGYSWFCAMVENWLQSLNIV